LACPLSNSSLDGAALLRNRITGLRGSLVPQPSIQFEEFELDVESCELRRSGRPLRLERIPMELLLLLLQNPGKLVRRQTIERSLWGEGNFLEAEHSINTAINKIRATLRDDSRDPRFIRTVVGQGYKFIAQVKLAEPDEDAATSSEPSVSPGVSHGSPESLAASTDVTASTSFTESVASDNGIGVHQVDKQGPEIVAQAPGHEAHRFSGRWFIAGSLASLAVLLLAFAANHYLRAPQKGLQTSEPASGFRSIAVLPFRDLAPDGNQNYLVDGMTDQLISDLAMNTQMRVISHQSVMQYKDVQLSLPEIAKALNVDMIVEGSYLRQGREIRITAQLLDAQNDRHLWAQTYREGDKDLLAMQDKVTHDIARQVAFATGGSFTQPKSQNVNEEARNAYLRGRYLWNERTASGLIKSVQYYTDAIRADHNYAEAYAALSLSYLTLSVYGGQDPGDTLWKAQLAAERALALDSNMSSAHTALAGVKTDKDWDWKGAEEEYRRAIAINPSDATAHHWYGLHLIRLGRGQEGLMELERALSIDPLSLIIATDMAESYYLLRNYTEALNRIYEVLTLNPNFAQAHIVKGRILDQMGRSSEAEKEFVSADRLFGPDFWAIAEQGNALALAGKRNEAKRIAQEMEDASRRRYITGVDIAEIYCALHQPDDAMEWLERAYQHHDTGINMIGVEPLFDNCRPDPHFQELLRRLKLKG
jgi:TolB-like protein/DNA-binding winged helix-turn-helix (wHTH) protein/Flp pilus assembly protein TadD